MERVNGTLRTSSSAIPAVCANRPSSLPERRTSLDDVSDRQFGGPKETLELLDKFDVGGKA